MIVRDAIYRWSTSLYWQFCKALCVFSSWINFNIILTVFELYKNTYFICTLKVSCRERELGTWRVQIWSSLHETVLWAGSRGLGCCHYYRSSKLTKTLTFDTGGLKKKNRTDSFLTFAVICLSRIWEDFSTMQPPSTSPLTCYSQKALMKVSDCTNIEGCFFFFSFHSWNYDLMYVIFQTLAITGSLEVLRTMRSQGVQFNKDTMTLAIGTCYKLVMFKWIEVYFI